MTELVRAKYLAAARVEAPTEDCGNYVGLEHVRGSTAQLVDQWDGDGEAVSGIAYKTNDVLFGKLRPYLSKSWLADRAGVCSGEFLVLRADAGLLDRFLKYLTLSQPWLEHAATNSYGSKMPRTTWEAMGEFEIPLPTLAIQRGVAHFLDREMAKIDALIARQICLEDALTYRTRVSLLEHVSGRLTNGKCDAVPHPWFGSIPQHWKVGRLSWAARVRSGDARSYLDVSDAQSLDANVPVIGGNGVLGYTSESNVESDAIAVGRVGALCGNVHLVNSPAWITDNALRIDVIEGYTREFLALLLRARDLNSMASQTAQPLVTGVDLARLRLPVPPEPTQSTIVNAWKREEASLTDLMLKSRDLRRVLLERRSSLITAAVTGQIDVTTYGGAGLSESVTT